MNCDVNFREWWKKATIYQIYPKSFCDSGAKGVGDIRGIISKLDYLQWVGIDAIWITPIYPSPMIDNGYDISDYYDVNPDFGNLADFDELVSQAHRRGIRIILDIVVNHTSTEHPWFKDALGNKQSPYRDYYIWRQPSEKGIPNNWQSKFGGPAWKLDEQTNEYYLHLFAPEQADLNWENPEVRREVENIISYWAERGVDGFRLDVINLISKQQDFCDDETGDGRRFYTDGPRVHEYLEQISDAVFKKYGSVTVGEMSSTTLEHCQRYASLDGKELSMVFNFHHLKVDYPNGEKWKLAPFDFIELKRLFNYWQSGLYSRAWGALFWCNHDQPRIVSRFGDEKRYRAESAKLLATSLHMLQGTPYVYQGEEIGMTNPGFTDISQYRDVESTNMYQLLVQDGKVSEEEMLAILAQRSRDNSRTPVPWDGSQYHGFSQAQPWIGFGCNANEVNVAAAQNDPDSVLYFYRQLIALRKEFSVIESGEYQDLLPEDPQLWCYKRKDEWQTLWCLNNYSDQVCTIPAEALPDSPVRLLLSNYQVGKETNFENEIILQPYQTLILLSD